MQKIEVLFVAFVIMMNGHVACLKTAIGRRLSDEIKAPIIETNKFGKIIGKDGLMVDEERDKRYAVVFEIADLLLGHGYPLILDGTFAYRKWRSMAYSLCKKHSVTEVLVIRCTSSSEQVIKERLAERMRSSFLPEREVCNFENYLQSVEQDEPPFGDALPWGGKLPLIEFDSAAYKIISIKAKGSLAARAIKVIECLFPKP